MGAVTQADWRLRCIFEPWWSVSIRLLATLAHANAPQLNNTAPPARARTYIYIYRPLPIPLPLPLHGYSASVDIYSGLARLSAICQIYVAFDLFSLGRPLHV
jgi:hypothetical protein